MFNGILSFTIIGAFKASPLATSNVLFKTFGSGVLNQIQLAILTTGKFRVLVSDSGGNIALSSVNNYNDDIWHTFAFVWDHINKTVNLYLGTEHLTFSNVLMNGLEPFNNTLGSAGQVFSGSPYNPPTLNVYTRFQGGISDFQVYNSILTLNQINGIDKYMSQRLGISFTQFIN